MFRRKIWTLRNTLKPYLFPWYPLGLAPVAVGFGRNSGLRSWPAAVFATATGVAAAPGCSSGGGWTTGCVCVATCAVRWSCCLATRDDCCRTLSWSSPSVGTSRKCERRKEIQQQASGRLATFGWFWWRRDIEEKNCQSAAFKRWGMIWFWIVGDSFVWKTVSRKERGRFKSFKEFYNV